MKKGITILLLSLISLCSVGAAVTSTVAWFTADKSTDNVEGGAIASYFESGTGDAADDPSTENIVEGPYIISSRNHLYNLAWLQYIGYFNDSTNFSGIKQCYFKIKNDIDMEGITIPPIGTEKYPFLGHFDGNGKTISDFTISNDNPAPDNSDFGVAKPANLFGGTVSVIVGFFGVVGKLPSQSITYDSSIVSVENVKLDDFTVKSKTSTTLIGLAAGYIDGDMSGVKVGKSKISLNGQTSTTITDNLSDYGLVGYTTNTDVGGGSYSQGISQWYNSSSSADGGTDEEHSGGNVSVKSVYNRLTSIKSSADTHSATKYVKTVRTDADASDPSIGVSTTIADSNHLHDISYNNYIGSFCFSDAPDATGLQPTHYLTGKRIVQQEILDYRTGHSERKVFINCYGESRDRNKYLNPKNNGTGFIMGFNSPSWEDDPSSAYGWYITDTDFSLSNPTHLTLGKLYSIDGDGNKWWLCIKKNTDNNIRPMQEMHATEPSGTNFIWTVETTNYTNTINGTSYKIYYISTTYNSTKYYLRSTAVVRSSANQTYEGMMIRDVVSPEVSYNNTNYTENNDTYFPLITTSDADNNAADNNTGYVISSSDYDTPNFRGAGAIQVSQHNRKATVHNYDADVGKSDILTNKGSEIAANSGSFTNFNDAYTKFDPKDKNTDQYFYGLQFQNSTITISNYVTIPNGKLNYGTFTNRTYPRNCIDFSVANKGFVSFFAGTYKDGINAFFSLYKINRNNSGALSSVDEILQIYTHTAPEKPYIYKTQSDPNPTIPAGYTLAFDSTWITNPSSITANKLYYFEIPLNGGSEYAIGSIPGKNGAMLLYLEVGASKASAANSITGYYVKTISTGNRYAVGVDFAYGSATGVGGETICLCISSGETGLLIVNANSSQISITNPYSDLNYVYKKSGVPVTIASGNTPGGPPGSSNVYYIKSYFTASYYGASHTVTVTQEINATTNQPTATAAIYTLDGNVSTYADVNTATGISDTHINALRTNRAIIVMLERTGGTANFNLTGTFDLTDKTIVTIAFDTSGFKVTTGTIMEDYTVKYGQATWVGNREYTI